MGCMSPVADGMTSCPSCGYDGKKQNPISALKIGSTLNDERYVVGVVSEIDCESVTYIAYDVIGRFKVTIKEFVPEGGCSRDKDFCKIIPKVGAEFHYKTSFDDFSTLYKNLFKIKDEKGLVRMLDFFEQNSTGYAVFEYFEMMTLKEFLALKNSFIPWDRCSSLMRPIIDAVGAIHSVNLMHRGVSVETVFVSRNGTFKLGGFATASVRTKGKDLVTKIFPGYAAPEQYSTAKFQTPATDVYSLAAVIYRCLTGITPQEADQRLHHDHMKNAGEIIETIPTHVSKALTCGLMVNQKARAENTEDFQQMLDNVFEQSAKRAVPPKFSGKGKSPLEIGSELHRRSQKADEQQQPINQPIEKQNDVFSKLKFVMSASIGLVIIVAACFFIFDGHEQPMPGSVFQPDLDDGMINVPNYIGLSEDEIEQTFDSRFKIVVEQTFDETRERDVIIDQSIAPGTPVESGTEIVLYYNTPVIIVIQNYIGMTKDEIEQRIIEIENLSEHTSFDVEIIESEVSSYESGTVFGQSFEQGTAFDLTTDTLILMIAK